MAKDGIEDPQKYFEIDTFTEDPTFFYTYFQLLKLQDPKPSLTHMFLSKLEKENKLLRCYTQNIDNLESEVCAELFSSLTLIGLFYLFYI